MRVLLPCRACGRHIFSDETECPFCRAAAKRTASAPGVVFGGALMVAAAACSGSLDGAPNDAAADTAIAQQDSASPSPGIVDSASAEDTSVADTAAADDVTVVSVSDVETIDVRKAVILDAAVLVDANDAKDADADASVFPVMLYRSPPRRSDWS
jgi:predicted nucleic acid-binding Zn ribbon protein